MSANITKLIIISIILTVALGFLGLQIFPFIGLENVVNNQQFAIGMGIGALIASMAASIILLVKPYNLTIKKQTLFVGNLAFRASERELRNLFSQCGEVFSIRLMTDKVTRKPRGYGFIEMDMKGAKKALNQLNEEEFMGRDLRVSPANEPSNQD